MFKRIMSFILGLCMCLSLVSMTAFASNERYILRSSHGSGGYITKTGRYTVEEGGSMTFTIVANQGYKVKDVYIDGRSVGPRDYYTFSNVNQNHFIRAEFERYNMDWLYQNDKSRYLDWYIDVKPHHWYYEYTAKAIDYGVVHGVYGNTFIADSTFTRGEMAQLLHNISMNPINSEMGTYPDVPADSKMYQAVDFCVRFGYLDLMENGNFEPDAPISREDIAVVLWKYHGSKNLWEYKMNSNDVFKDVNKISSDAMNAMTWCIEKMIFLGDPGYNLNPKSNVTRAEAAAILVRYMENVYYA